MQVVRPLAAVIATRDRPATLQRTLTTLGAQTRTPEILVVVDASPSDETRRVFESHRDLFADARYIAGKKPGAAAQRNLGVTSVRDVARSVLFLDDDVRLAPDCIEQLATALEKDLTLGGVSAMIANQRYLPPGMVSRTLFRLLHGRREESYAGLCIGPVLNLLPEDRPDGPSISAVQWLNTTCTLYRMRALPRPPFPAHFTGYSLFEDVALSLTVGKRWKLANVRLAQLVHDSQHGPHKSDACGMARMELVNRHFVMTRILERRAPIDYVQLCIIELFGLVNELRTKAGIARFPRVVLGKWYGMLDLLLPSRTTGG